MNKKIMGIIFVAMLAISMIPVVEANNDISILPPSISITGESGDFVTRSIMILNTCDRNMTVMISPPSNIYLSRNSLSLGKYGSANITLWATIPDESYSGVIYYNYSVEGGGTFTRPQPIIINPEVEVTMQLFPSRPKPGGNMLILLTPPVSGLGFIFYADVGNVSYFNVTDGFRLTSIPRDAIGEAMIYVRGESFNPIIKTITIGNVSGGSLHFDVPSDVTINDTATVKLFRDGSAEPYYIVSIEKPSGASYTQSTNIDGQITIKFDEEGKWKFEAGDASATVSVAGEAPPPSIIISAPSSADIGDTIYVTLLRAGAYVPNEKVIIQKPDSPLTYQYTNELGQVVLTVDKVGHWTVAAGGKSHAIDVSKKEMVIGIPSDAEAGHSAAVEVDEGSHVRIVGVDYSKEWDASSGTVTFTPPTSGIYEVTAETDTSKGKRAFQVFETPTIALFNPQGIQVTTGFSGSAKANPGQYYYIKVLSGGEVVGSIDSVEVAGPPSQIFPTGKQTVSIGSLWQPREGVYTVTSPETGLYKEATLVVESAVAGGGGGDWWQWPVVAIVCGGLGVIAIAYKKGWRPSFKKKEKDDKKDRVE